VNERIKELEPQCWEHNEFGLNFNYQKFAELIIQEAGEAFWSEACHVSDLAYEEYYRNSKKIRQHFGVKE
jgi:hypothetical protein